jgi:hypothetical protein
MELKHIESPDSPGIVTVIVSYDGEADNSPIILSVSAAGDDGYETVCFLDKHQAATLGFALGRLARGL